MSEEIMTSAADLTTMIGLRAENDGLREQLAHAERAQRIAEANAAACYRILEVLSRAGDIASVRGVVSAALPRLHPGAVLLAELEAARAVVEAARYLASGVESTGWTRIYATLDAYDEATKARDG